MMPETNTMEDHYNYLKTSILVHFDFYSSIIISQSSRNEIQCQELPVADMKFVMSLTHWKVF